MDPAGNPPQLDEDAQKFVQFVVMHAQQILYVLGGQTPDGESVPANLEAAKVLTDQLETIQKKTKGNLSPQEEMILKETLSRVQMAFVQASGGTPASMMPDRNIPMPDDLPEEAPAPPAPAKEETPAAQAPEATPAKEEAPAAEPEKKDDEDENKKRFTKSYG